MSDQEDISIRKANLDDVDIYYHWANDFNVRKNARNSDPIPYESHLQWFKNRIDSSTCFMYVILYKNEPCGQIRFDVDESQDEAEIDFSVDRKFRGMGLGKFILEVGVNHFLEETQRYYKIKGIVKEGNIPSIKAFNSNGFFESDSVREKNEIFKVFVKY